LGNTASIGCIYLLREVERTVALVRFCGQVWDIDQTLHTFRLDVERVDQELQWRLHFDPIIDSRRRTRNAAYALTGPEVVEWRVTLSGKSKKRQDGFGGHQ
jgi:hypothetical protein